MSETVRLQAVEFEAAALLSLLGSISILVAVVYSYTHIHSLTRGTRSMG